MEPLPSSEEITDLLVAYALDALEPEEHERVSQLLRERPELRSELAELCATVAKLPLGLPESTPPPDLRRRVLDRAVGRAPGGRLTRQGITATGGLISLTRGWLTGLGGLAAALLLALAVSLGQFATARADLARAQAELAAARLELGEVARVVAQPVALAHLTGNGGRATVLQTAEGELLLAAQLPPLAAGRVYQLWLIEGQNSPASGGTFTVSADGFGLLALDAGSSITGATLAITDEPTGGSVGPTTAVLLTSTIS